MPLFVLLAQDDASSVVELLTDPEASVAQLNRAIMDVKGETLALLTTSGKYPLVGIVDLPNHAAATALSLVSRAIGRSIELVPAVAIHEFDQVLEEASRINVAAPQLAKEDGVE